MVQLNLVVIDLIIRSAKLQKNIEIKGLLGEICCFIDYKEKNTLKIC